MTTKTATVKVAVPKSTGRRHIRHLGVFVADKGVINVDVPFGLQFGDEFELTYDTGMDLPNVSKVLRIPVPDGVQPGTVFKHKAPNGKNISVSCPPDVKEDCDLLVPWSDATSEHFLIQGMVAPPEVKPQPPRMSSVQPPQHRAGSTTYGRGADGDFRLAQALSLTQLYLNEDAEMKKALEASLKDYHPAAQSLRLSTTESGEAGRPASRKVTAKVSEPGEAELQRVLKASFEEYMGKANNGQHGLGTRPADKNSSAHEFQQQRKHRPRPRSPPQNHMPHSTATGTKSSLPYTSPHGSEDEVLDEEAILRQVEELSLKEAYDRAQKDLGNAPYEQPGNGEFETVFPHQASENKGDEDDGSKLQQSMYPSILEYGYTGADKHVDVQSSLNDDYDNFTKLPNFVLDPDEERLAFLNSLPEDIRREVLQQETLQEQALRGGRMA